jgi:hypothetical protein
MPAVFLIKLKNMAAIADESVGRIMDMFDLGTGNIKRWSGDAPRQSTMQFRPGGERFGFRRRNGVPHPYLPDLVRMYLKIYPSLAWLILY